MFLTISELLNINFTFEDITYEVKRIFITDLPKFMFEWKSCILKC